MYNLVFCNMPLHFLFCISLGKYVSLSDLQGHQRYAFQLYLFILQLLLLELCTSYISCCKMLQKFSPGESGCFCFLRFSPNKNFQETLASIYIFSLHNRYRPLFFIRSLQIDLCSFLDYIGGYVLRSTYGGLAKKRAKETPIQNTK